MENHDRIAEELAHIGTAIALLECAGSNTNAGRRATVMSPAYWYGRIARLQAENLPSDLDERIHTLLGRLDALCESPDRVPRDPPRPHRQ